MTSIIYDLEPEERKEYLSEMFGEGVLNLDKQTTIQDYYNRVQEILKKDKKNLTLDQLKFRNYYEGEQEKDKFLQDTFNRSKDKIRKDKIEEIKQSKNLKFRSLRDKPYKVLRSVKTNKEKGSYGYINNKRVNVRYESRLIRGKEIIQLRDKKTGRIAGFFRR